VDRRIRFGLLGCGAMGSTIAKSFDGGGILGDLKVVYDINGAASSRLSKLLESKPNVASDFSQLLDSCDFVIEAASQQAVFDHAAEVLNAGKDVLVMSVGALMDRGLRDAVEDACRRAGSHVYLPSGAILGVDGLKAASVLGVEEVSLTTTKPPGALAGVKYLEDQGIDVKLFDKPTVVFEGGGVDAAKSFPQNINVAAIVALSTGCDVKVTIIVDPNSERNVHEIVAKGRFGVIKTVAENVPSPENPKTSYLAVLSAISVLRQVSGSVKIGN